MSHDRWQPASFRGVRFLVDNSELKAGRRNITKNAPYHDDTVTEDLGRMPRKYSFNAYVIGDDHAIKRDALLAALETFGVGELVHPDYGRQRVVVDGEQSIKTPEQGRITLFKLSFIQAGQVNQNVQRNVRALAIQAYQQAQQAQRQQTATALNGGYA